jgi:hypothetical protein
VLDRFQSLPNGRLYCQLFWKACISFPIPLYYLQGMRRVKHLKDTQRSRCRVGKLRAWLYRAPRSSTCLHSPMLRNERMLEYVIRHAAALGYTLGLVKCPMNTEVNAALAVLFLCFRER